MIESRPCYVFGNLDIRSDVDDNIRIRIDILLEEESSRLYNERRNEWEK